MEIKANGSKMLGDPPDSFEQLIEVLKNNKLDPKFTEYGNFFFKGYNSFIAWGNFQNLSHVFHIEGTLGELYPLALALKKNRRKYGIRLPKNQN